MNPFVRMLAFFGAAWVLLVVLRSLPGIGPFFHGFFAFWVVVIVLSIALERGAVWAGRRRRMASEARALGNVESPHNRGKLGSLYLGAGRPRAAIAPLRQAVEGEPDSAEWRYRLGQALLATGEHAEAVESLEAAAAIDEEHAYGGCQLGLAEGYLALDRPEPALERLAVFERNHGPSPESAYRRGLALKRLGRGDEAARAFDEVVSLAHHGARYQRRESGRFAWRARLARMF